MSPYGKYLPPEEVGTIAVLGTGSVGASWMALFLAHGIRVRAFDPAPQAEARARSFVSDAWAGLRALGIARQPAAPQELISFCSSVAEAAAGAEVIQENVPERPALKKQLLEEVERATSPETIIISSTGGISPSSLQQYGTHPQRLVVIHPFNPTHLIPLVEVIGGKDTADEIVEWAMAFSRRLGKHPIRLRKEASGHMTNRLQFALMREAVYCLVEGIASAEDIDAAVRYGLGPRWALMGGILTLHLAGGPHGMKGILDHAGDAIEGWMTPLGSLRLTEDVRNELVEAADQVAGGHAVAEWVHWRDESLVRLLALLQQHPEPELRQ